MNDNTNPDASQKISVPPSIPSERMFGKGSNPTGETREPNPLLEDIEKSSTALSDQDFSKAALDPSTITQPPEALDSNAVSTHDAAERIAELVDDFQTQPPELETPNTTPENVPEVSPPAPITHLTLFETISVTGRISGVDIPGTACPNCKSEKRVTSRTKRANELRHEDGTRHEWYLHQCENCKTPYRQHLIIRKRPVVGTSPPQPAD